jgi:hypothetical protein
MRPASLSDTLSSGTGIHQTVNTCARVQPVPAAIATELAERVPEIFSLSSDKSHPCMLQAKCLRENENLIPKVRSTVSLCTSGNVLQFAFLPTPSPSFFDIRHSFPIRRLARCRSISCSGVRHWSVFCPFCRSKTAFVNGHTASTWSCENGKSTIFSLSKACPLCRRRRYLSVLSVC